MARSPDRRDRDRYHRDRREDRPSTRRRSRSRDDVRHSIPRRSKSPELTHQQRSTARDSHDRDHHHRRDRSYERHGERRRDRSRDYGGDKKRHRDHSSVRNKREDSSRYRDSRDLYDDRDRKRARHDDVYNGSSPRRARGSTPGRLSPPRYDDRDSYVSWHLRGPGTKLTSQSPNSPVPQNSRPQDEAAKKAERLAKLQALKKQAEAKAGAATPIRSNGGDASPQSSTAASETSKDVGRIAPPKSAALWNQTLGVLKPARPSNLEDGATSSKKVDPLEVRKRAIAAMARNRIDTSVVSTGFASSSTSNANAKSIAAVAGLEDDDDASVERKIEKLPTMLPAIDDVAITTAENGEDEDDDERIGSDDDMDEAARENAQQRALEAQKSMPEQAVPVAAEADSEMKDDEDDVDPLDAFMSTLDKPPEEEPDLLRDYRGGKKKRPKAFNSDDEGDLDAIGISLDGVDANVKKRKKDVPKVNHSKMNYEPFRKEFYSESLELADLTEEEVEVMRADMDNIKVAGTNVPKPIQSFPQGGFGVQILDVIRGLSFEKPTAIQAQALPAIMSGRDTLGVAKTGSGKTMAYLLPLFRHVKDQRPLQGMDGPIALVLAPTRELAVQIHKDCKPFLKSLDLRACCAYGGSPISDQIAELKRGAEIVVATPGRLIDLLAANAGRVTNLARITYLVLDEADRMFDMGFEPQITRIIGNIRPDRQTVLFSATFPKSMEGLARKTLNKPVEITVGGRSVVGAEIDQIVEVVDHPTKWLRLLSYLGQNHKADDGSRSLIFVERHEAADSLMSQLTKAGYMVVSLHGGREQSDRDQFISDFKKGLVPVLIATSVAARGLDVKGLNLVINYDCPNHREDYVHRCGRTGRAGNTGTAVTFLHPEQERFAGWLVRALTDSKKEVPPKLQELADEFDKKVKSGEAKKAFAGGFGGRGIERIEAARDQNRAALKKQFAGQEDGVEETAEDKQKAETAKSETEKLLAAATSTVQARDEAPPKPAPATSDDPDGDLRSDLKQYLKDAMTVTKAEAQPAAAATTSASRGPAGNSKMSKLERAAAAAASVNNRLGAKGASRPDAPSENRGPDAGAYSAVLKINDFPQKARWGVTNRTNVLKILESTGTSITTKGIYYPPGSEPAAGEEPKLYILVEGDTKVVVENAMHLLLGHLREGLAQDGAAKAQQDTSSGRYSVV